MKNTLLFPAVQALHVVGLGLMVGTIALNDWRVLQGKPEEHLGRWSVSGFALMAITGIALFLADTTRYLSNAAFGWKMALIAVGVVFQFVRRPSRLTSCVSLTLWSAAVVASTLIADFDK